MIKLCLNSLKPGMKIARTIYNSSSGALLKAGAVLSERNIKKLKNFGIPFVYIDNEKMPPNMVRDVVSQETRIAAVSQVKNILIETKESGKLVIKPQEMYSTVRDFTSQILNQGSLLANLADLRSQDDYTFAHSVNVCVLALMTGITLGFSQQDLDILGTGAMLHDLGKVSVPDWILNKPGKLSTDEFALIREHTVCGYELIRAAGNMNTAVSLTAYQHHENFDGSGYPKGISGDKIHEFAQITGICDRFDALTAERVYHRPFPPHEAYEMCAASGDYLFKDYIVKAFLSNIAAYPAGTQVEMSNGMIGVVLETPRGYSLFPRVRVICDTNNNYIANQYEMFLHEEENCRIVRIMD